MNDFSSVIKKATRDNNLHMMLRRVEDIVASEAENFESERAAFMAKRVRDKVAEAAGIVQYMMNGPAVIPSHQDFDSIIIGAIETGTLHLFFADLANRAYVAAIEARERSNDRGAEARAWKLHSLASGAESSYRLLKHNK